jgi:BirA family biotin operon repressor/biotin-[acetyl-CoA-carboxylase] ligase
MMNFDVIHIAETDSTNHWLRNHSSDEDMVVWTDYQTAGRGCGTNTWESERGKNLTCSILIHPLGLEARQQFSVSMTASLAVVDALADYTDGLSIKWPNDIYWHDRKICGILIENRLTGGIIKDSIIGIGVNANQAQFVSDAPNPVSLRQILGHEVDREQLLTKILHHLTLPPDAARYRALLYRREGIHRYSDASGAFEASLVNVEDDGHLLLKDTNGHLRRYAFKEVAFLGITE